MSLNILSLTPLPEGIQNEITKSDPSIELTMAPGWFDGEIRDTWPKFTIERYLTPHSNSQSSKLERDKLLGAANIIIVGFPFLIQTIPFWAYFVHHTTDWCVGDNTCPVEGL